MIAARLTHAVYPLALLAAWHGRAGRRRSSGEAAAHDAGSDSVVLPWLKKRELRARLAAGEEASSFELRGADLAGMDLTGRDLGSVDLTRARLRGARLRGARLAGANLTYADLSQADLTGADLSSARLLEADLTAADLSGADLATAGSVELAALRRARYTKETCWPAGFDPSLAGAVLVDRRSLSRP